MVALVLGMVYADHITSLAEQGQYPGQAVFARSTPYQRIVVTRQADDIRLFLNGNLQFSSRDEYRYHEALVHPLLARPGRRGGARAGRRRWPGGARAAALSERDIDHLVDLDPEVTSLFSRVAVLARAQRRCRCARPRCTSSTPTPSSGSRRRASAMTPSWSTFRTRPTTRSASSSRSRSTGACTRSWRPEAGPSSRAPRRTLRRRPTGASSTPCRPPDSSPRPTMRFVPSFGEWGFVLPGSSPCTRRHPAGGPALSHDPRCSPDVSISAGHAARTHRGQPPRQPGAGALFREEWGRYLAE
jgi:spermidine synthase